MQKIIIAILMVVGFQRFAFCGEILKTYGRDDNMMVSLARIIYKGSIEKGDAKKILGLMPFAINNSYYASHGYPEHHHAPVILINSRGGDVSEAMIIGRILRKYNAMVIVDYECMSACTLILAGASTRAILGLPPFGETKLGIHRIRSVNPKQSELTASQAIADYNRMKRDVFEYLLEMGVSNNLSEKMFKVGSEEIYFLKDSEADQWGLTGTDPAYAEYMRVKDIEVYGAACMAKQDLFKQCLISGNGEDACRSKTKFYGCKPLQ